MTTQKALVLTSKGHPMALTTLPLPTPKETQLLIKMKVCGLNIMDQRIRDIDRFNFYASRPAVCGSDLVGVVVNHGSGTSTPPSPRILGSFPIGSRIFSQCVGFVPSGGRLQEYTLVNADYTALVPEGVRDEDAASWPINAVTVGMAMFSKGGFRGKFPGTEEWNGESKDLAAEKLVIIGGGTTVGKLGLQFARLAGVGMIVTTASLSGEEELKRLGATHVVARQADDVVDQVRGIVGDELVYVLDCTPGGNHDLAVSLLSNEKKGIFVHLSMGKVDEDVAAKKKAGYEDKQIWGWSHLDPEFGKLFWREFPKLVESGKIKPLTYIVIEGLDAEKINAAFDEMAALKGMRYHVRF
jgi:NADPH:quinone reductase